MHENHEIVLTALFYTVDISLSYDIYYQYDIYQLYNTYSIHQHK